ncbi:MAG: site-specific integrase [Bacteroidales bacterium]|nr:site-specific integrase [Bacteroidales bacterium]
MPPLSQLVPARTNLNRTYLEAYELQQLIKTPCSNKCVSDAFLFSCYTGLRLSDVETLKRRHIVTVGQRHFIVKRQVKTRHEVRIPLMEAAYQILMDQPTTNHMDSTFFHLPCRRTIKSYLDKWCVDAGIGKHVTFHVSRHTYATLLIASGTDIFVVSKLCGHTNVKTTQIYADVIDRRRTQAVDQLESMLSVVASGCPRTPLP